MHTRISVPLSLPVMDLTRVYVVQPVPIRVRCSVEQFINKDVRLLIVDPDLESYLRKKRGRVEKIEEVFSSYSKKAQIRIGLNRDFSQFEQFIRPSTLRLSMLSAVYLCVHTALKLVSEESVNLYEFDENLNSARRFIDELTETWEVNDPVMRPMLWSSLLGSESSYPVLYVKKDDWIIKSSGKPNQRPFNIAFVKYNDKNMIYERYKPVLLGRTSRQPVSKFEKLIDQRRSSFKLAESLRTKPTREGILLDIALGMADAIESANAEKLAHFFYLADLFDHRRKLKYLFESKEEKLALVKAKTNSKHSCLCYVFRDEWDPKTSKIKGNFSERLKMTEGVQGLKVEESFLEYTTLDGTRRKIIGQSPAMRKVFKFIKKVANADDSGVLITGESGTGKEEIAEAIHYMSARKNHPFKTIDCGTIEDTLARGELFGHKKGSYTGAISTEKGQFKEAEKGTAFLDEVGNMNSTMQAIILRVIDKKEFVPIGFTESEKVDIRIIAATNKNLEQAVKDREFREDLYYRLKILKIELPPLRERKEDIPLLAEHFLKQKRQQDKSKEITGFSKEVQRIFVNYNWLGNVRELKNVVESSFVMAEGNIITAEDLPEDIRKTQLSDSQLDPKDVIQKALGEPVTQKVLNRLVQAYTTILEEGKMTRSEYCQKFGISCRTAERDIDLLKRLIEKKGRGRNTFYVICK